MTAKRPPPRIDYVRLGNYLRVLGTPTRLELLRELRIPRTSREVQLTPFRRDQGLDPDRNLSRQAVDGHIKKLQEIDLVRARPARRDGRPTTEYEVDQARLFVLLEELRRLTLLRPATGLTADTLGTQDATAGPTAGTLPTSAAPALAGGIRGPVLLLVNGPREGHAFSLDGGGPWAVGRDGTCEIALGYDPFVSRHNARIARRGRAFVVTAVPGARNGTHVNGRHVPDDRTAFLETGDVIGVGRSLLVFRAEAPRPLRVVGEPRGRGAVTGPDAGPRTPSG